MHESMVMHYSTQAMYSFQWNSSIELPDDSTRLDVSKILARMTCQHSYSLDLLVLSSEVIVVLLSTGPLCCNRAPPPFGNTSGFLSLIVIDEQLTVLTITSWHLTCNLDHRKYTFEAMYLVENFIHLLERTSGSFGLQSRVRYDRDMEYSSEHLRRRSTHTVP